MKIFSCYPWYCVTTDELLKRGPLAPVGIMVRLVWTRSRLEQVLAVPHVWVLNSVMQCFWQCDCSCKSPMRLESLNNCVYQWFRHASSPAWCSKVLCTCGMLKIYRLMCGTVPFFGSILFSLLQNCSTNTCGKWKLGYLTTKSQPRPVKLERYWHETFRLR